MKRDDETSLGLDSFGLGDDAFDARTFGYADESLLTVAEWKDLVAAHLFELPERLDIRLLWSRNGTSFCRVNVWLSDSGAGVGRILRSLFVALDDTPDGPRVRDLTDRRAA